MNIMCYQTDLKDSCLDIFISGCDGHCYGCHNPELHDFKEGVYYKEYMLEIISFINKLDEIASIGGVCIRYIRLLGGEPLLQDEDSLKDFVTTLLRYTTKEIILFTRFDLDEVPLWLKRVCSFIKTGSYDYTVIDYSNQYGFEILSNQKLNKRGIDYYVD